ncbi:MAG: hypothetical protein JJ892_10115 [Balneola sp.]|nr:hypothetical protein [Balneola sp.]MBO6649448.1 hypothetical protein [Balneola sp.]MBO6711263.1 hypothetical protein [Balneola sp.]MBO6800622.1 hypothetical protein [Balneola sp.]MBO6869198.1 hypothetical protein [Balneola sp.]
MSKIRLKFFVQLIITIALLNIACADLNVDNNNDPDIEDILFSGEDRLNHLKGASNNLFFNTLLDLRGVHTDLLADQLTTTNKYFSFFDFSVQPRIEFNNEPSFINSSIYMEPWSNLNASISSANDILTILNRGGSVIVDEIDITDRAEANAYFIRGLARSYIGLIYDRGYIVEIDSDLTAISLVPSSQVLQAGIEDIETALEIANNTANYSFDLFPGNNDYSTEEFNSIANSYLARVSAGRARTSNEAESINWSKVLAYANKGLGQPNAGDGGALSNFSPTSVDDTFFNEAMDWISFNIGNEVDNEPISFLLPDNKIIHQLDQDYPVDYPVDMLPDTASSSDQRLNYYMFNQSDFWYASNRELNSDYFNLRLYADNDWTASGYPVILFTKAEVNYLRAEAQIMMNNRSASANILSTETPFGTESQSFEPNLPSVQAGYMSSDGLSGNNSIVGNATREEFQLALLREYSVELQSMGGFGLQWFFMRRHDLLQEGSGLEYPVPGEELLIAREEVYTFGGVGNPESTSQGSNTWKTLRDKISIDANDQGPKIFSPRKISEFPTLQDNVKVEIASTSKRVIK